MNKQQSKQAIHDRSSKTRLSIVVQPKTVEKTSAFSAESKRRLMSKMSLLGSAGSRIFFHRRGDRLKIPKYQNTYRLEPFRAFNVEVVDKIVRDVMENKLAGLTSYQPDQSAKLCLEIATDVEKAIVKKDFDR